MKTKHLWWLGGLAVVIIAFGGYAARSQHYKTRFLPKTEVLGVDVGGQTIASADKALQRHVADSRVKFEEHGKTLAQATGADLGLQRDFRPELQRLMKRQNPWRLTATVLAADNAQAALAKDNPKLTAYTDQLTATLNAKRQAPVDAKVVAADGKFVVQKEQAGNQIDAKKLAKSTAAAVSAAKPSVALAKTYLQPKVTTDNDQLKSAAKSLTKIATLKAQVKVTGKNIVIPAATLQSWLSYDHGVQVDQAKVSAYVAELADAHNTYGKARTFQSTRRGTVTVPAGTYGWSIAQDQTVKNLVAEIKKGKDFTKEVSWQGSGYHNDGTDIGNTYVEVDVANQHEYFYQDGKLVLDTAIVTGKPGQDTPRGVNFVWDKSRNKTLRGKNDDGSSYASPVSYWMPIDYTGVGLHDSGWQKQYGGTWYKKHGSHGCVNNPPAFMAKLFAAVPLGTPVIVF